MKRFLGSIASTTENWRAPKCSISIQCRSRISWQRRNRRNSEREGHWQVLASDGSITHEHSETC